MKEIKVWKIISIWLIIPVVSVVFLLLLMGDIDSSGVLQMFISFLSMLIITLILGRVNSSLIKERYGDFKEKVNIKEIIGVTITQIFISIGLSNLSIGFMAIKDMEKALITMNDTFGNPTTNIELILFGIVVVIIAPILEEISFRKVLFRGFSKRLNLVMAAILSSLLFGIGHDVLDIFGAIIFGYTCCILYRKYNNILIPISVHLLNNFLAFVFICVEYFTGSLNIPIEYISSYDIKINLILGSLITIISFIVFLKFIVKSNKYMKKNYHLSVYNGNVK